MNTTLEMIGVLRCLYVPRNDNTMTEYNEGPEALKKFEDGMKKLFQTPKPESPFKPPPAKPKEEPSKD